MLAGFDAGVSHCAKKMMDIMQNGTSFVDALKQSNDFDEYMIQMVVVGQSIGNLDVVLKELSDVIITNEYSSNSKLYWFLYFIGNSCLWCHFIYFI